MTGEEPMRQVYEPKDVAARLRMSVAGLRRLEHQYERVHGELPTNERGRLWPEEAVEAMEEARAIVRSGRAVSVEAALRGAISPEGVEVPPVPPRPAAGDLAALAEEVRALRGAVEEQNRLLREVVEEQNRRLGEQGERLAAVERARELVEETVREVGEETVEEVGEEAVEETVAPVPGIGPAGADPVGGEGNADQTPPTVVPRPEQRRERSWWRRIFGG